MVLYGATDMLAFEVVVVPFLVPTLRRGQLLDHRSVHTGTRVRALITGVGYEQKYLPSSDLTTTLAFYLMLSSRE
jgi:hypothetical protein